MLEEATNIAITGDITSMAVAYGIGHLVIALAFAGVFVAVGYLVYQCIRVIRSNAWYAINRDAYKVGMIKKHASENNIELCYEPDRKRKGLMQELDDDVKRDIA